MVTMLQPRASRCESFLEEERLAKTRTRDYFVILGLLSASPR